MTRKPKSRQPKPGDAKEADAAGKTTTDGKTTGEAITDGEATEGTVTGGKAIGGTAPDGKTTGEATTDGKATGGTATGGKATGGTIVEVVPAPPAKAASGLLALLWTVVVLAVLGGTGYATWPFWSPYLAADVPAFDQDPFQDPRMIGVTERVLSLEESAKTRKLDVEAIKDLEAERARFSKRLAVLIGRVETLEKSLESVARMIEAATLPSDAATTNESLQRLSERLARLEEERAATADDRVQLERTDAKRKKLSSEVTQIIDRLAMLEKTGSRYAGSESGARAVVLAVGQLRQALRNPAPFLGELQALEAAAGDDPDMALALAELEPYAASGIPPLASLRVRFDGVAGRIVGASQALEGDGWMERTVNRLTSLVSVRRVDDDPDDDSPDAIVARAEKSLKAGNLMKAVETLERLNGAAAEAAAPWLRDARARRAAEGAMAKLHVKAVSLLSPAEE